MCARLYALLAGTGAASNRRGSAGACLCRTLSRHVCSHRGKSESVHWSFAWQSGGASEHTAVAVALCCYDAIALCLHNSALDACAARCCPTL